MQTNDIETHARDRISPNFEVKSPRQREALKSVIYSMLYHCMWLLENDEHPGPGILHV